MLAESHLAVVARNVRWSGSVATEPYECGWAREAVFFVRALDAPTLPARVQARVEISPDGVFWAEEGTRLTLPTRRDETCFCRAAKFGGWLRLAADLPDQAAITVLVAIHLKG
jgi:hypothetical protein